MISTLVATKEGKWGTYAISTEMLHKQEQPLYLAPFDRPSEAAAAIDEKLPGQWLGFTSYGDFWTQVADAGIEKPEPEKMPHRQSIKEK
jgi:hypothetical protein